MEYSFDSERFEKEYTKAIKQQFEYLVFEHTHRAIILPANIGWSDIGTYKMIHHVSEYDDAMELRDEFISKIQIILLQLIDQKDILLFTEYQILLS